MYLTGSLRRQHDVAIGIVGQIEAHLAHPGIVTRNDALAVTMLLAKLAGVLRIHFAQEDHSLYPAMIASPNAETARVARLFFNEMGHIGPLFDAFAQRWTVTDTLLADPAGFAAESRTIFTALADRIGRENDQLYTLAEREAGQSRAA